MKTKKVIKKITSMFLMTMILMAFLTFISNAQTSADGTETIIESQTFTNDMESCEQTNDCGLIKSSQNSKIVSYASDFIVKNDAIFASQVIAPKYSGKIAPSIPEVKNFKDKMEETNLIEASQETEIEIEEPKDTEDTEETEELTSEEQIDAYTEDSTEDIEELEQTETIEEPSEDQNYEDCEENYEEENDEYYDEDEDYDETTTEVEEPESENFDEETEDQEKTYSNNNYSDDDIDLIARTTYQEAGGCSEYCQWLVASTILNLAEANGGIRSVVFNYNIFNVAYCLFTATPSDLSYSVARRVASGDRDYNVMAFRTDYYHDFGTPYTNTDNVYFSEY